MVKVVAGVLIAGASLLGVPLMYFVGTPTVYYAVAVLLLSLYLVGSGLILWWGTSRDYTTKALEANHDLSS